MTRPVRRTLRHMGFAACMLATSACAGAPPAASPATPSVGGMPRTYLMRPDQLQLAKQRLDAGDAGLRPAYERLLRC